MSETALDYTSMTEEVLAANARAGSSGAFRAIIQRCNQRLFRVARAVVGSDDEAEDVLQEAYLKAFAAITRFRGESRLLTWLTTITLNEARERLRQRRHVSSLRIDEDRHPTVLLFPGPASATNPEMESTRLETRHLLEGAIDRLPENFRIVFMLREIEGCTIDETAAQLDLNRDTVKTRHFRACRLLRKDLEERLSIGMADLFPFLGRRCERLADSVLKRLGTK